jgi:uncharacterized delta-60 repeat protein
MYFQFMKLPQLLSVSLLLVLLLCQPVAAQTLDPTFMPPTSLYSSGIVFTMGPAQADGKRLISGSFSRVNGTASANLTRLDATGAVDQAFAQNVGTEAFAVRIKGLPNGQYLLGGRGNPITAGGLTRTELLRLNADGTADAAFNAGSGPTNPGGYAYTSDFVVQPDGKILVAGYFNKFNGQPAAGLVRLNADGSVDTGFTIGTALQPPLLNVLALQPDGKVLVGGSFQGYTGQIGVNNGLMRFNADGTPDLTFASPLSTNSQVTSLVLQPDGKVLLAGRLEINKVAGTPGLVRLTSTGSVDADFSIPAYITGYSNDYFDSAIVLQPDGKILLGGYFAEPGANHLTRLNANGSRDASFQVSAGPSEAPATIGLQPDGSILVGGILNAFNGVEKSLGRLTNTGAPDPTFAPKLQSDATVTSVVRQADGQLILGGNFTELNGQPVHRVARVSATGVLDAAYSAAVGVLPGYVHALALQADGKVLVATAHGLRRLLASGSPETGYSTYAAAFEVAALALQPDGRALIGGRFEGTAGGVAFAGVARLTADGDFDPSFVRAKTSALGIPGITDGLLVQPDGRILLTSVFFDSSSGQGVYKPRLVRYESTGAIDATFSAATFTGSADTPGYAINLGALAQHPDGKLLVGGNFDAVNGTARPHLARLTATGALDASFAPVATLAGNVNAIAIQPNGRVLLGGTSNTATGSHLVRVLSNGQTDASFAATANPNYEVRALLVQPDGAIVLGGTFTDVGGQPAVGLARLTAHNVLTVAAPAAVAARTAVWPVPAHSVLHVTLDASARPRTLALLDALGRTVRTQPASSAADQQVDLAGLPAGVYLVRVQYAAGVVIRRIAVQ